MRPGFASALVVIAGAVAAAIVPPSRLTPSEWGALHLVEVEGPRAGQLWDPALTPYIAPIIDEWLTGPHPVATVRKPAQCGFTRGILAAWGYIACERPLATGMHVMPTTQLALDFNRDKLAPTIARTKVLERRIVEETTRGRPGSSALKKIWPGGWLKITGANSAPSLQSHTIRVACCDEIDQYVRDLDGQGSPMKMIDDRQKSFHATRDYKKLQGGTPTNKGESLVDEEFEKGDQRFWMMPCPHCGTEIRLLFGGIADGESGTGLRFNAQPPYDAHYIAQCCGARIDHWQKADMVRAGRFVATRPDPGRAPSYHIDGPIILLTTWDKIAETFLDAGDDPAKLKGFVNRWLGEAYEEKSDAPDWKLIADRREDFAERVIPADALIVTAGVDVQKLGLYVEILGWTAQRVAYTLYAGYIPAQGRDSSDPDDECWRTLTSLFQQPLTDAFGGTRRIDAMGLDCRYNAPTVYDWVRRHHGAYAIRTEEGWGHPVVKNPVAIDYDFRGKRIRKGVQQWKAGSYGLKARFYAQLRRESRIDEVSRERVWPAGASRFGSFLDEKYFRQLVCEYVGVNERGLRIWKQREPDNHFLDCRVLNMALFYGVLKAELYTEDHWRGLAADRGVPFIAQAPLLAAAATVPDPAVPPPASSGAAAPSRRPSGWSYEGRWT